MDEVGLRMVLQRMDSCVAISTETWLDSNTPASRGGARRTLFVQIGLKPRRARAVRPQSEHTAHLACEMQTTQNGERDLFQPDHSCLRSSAKLALEELYCLISNQMNSNPEAAVIVAADFGHVKLKAVLPKFWKFTHFLFTRDNSILYQVYYNTPRD